VRSIVGAFKKVNIRQFEGSFSENVACHFYKFVTTFLGDCEFFNESASMHDSTTEIEKEENLSIKNFPFQKSATIKCQGSLKDKGTSVLAVRSSILSVQQPNQLTI
jgi:hypothetical protein